MRLGRAAPLVRVGVCLVTVAAAGCYDFDALGGHDAGVDLGPTCMGPYDCAAGTNCVGGSCRAAAVDCAAQKQAFADAADGVYWIAPGGPGSDTLRVYCDMHLGTPATLCSAEATRHVGKTRDGSNLPIQFISVFTDDSATVCRIWAVQSLDSYPLGRRPPDKMPNTCQSLGFADDEVIGDGCLFGSNSSDCGYAGAHFYCYGHVCDSCQVGKGSHEQYTFMGPFTDGRALTNVAGTIAATCRTGLAAPVADR
jgi:hypothetical protein